MIYSWHLAALIVTCAQRNCCTIVWSLEQFRLDKKSVNIAIAWDRKRLVLSLRSSLIYCEIISSDLMSLKQSLPFCLNLWQFKSWINDDNLSFHLKKWWWTLDSITKFFSMLPLISLVLWLRTIKKNTMSFAKSRNSFESET